jgi:hypothetical protein
VQTIVIEKSTWTYYVQSLSFYWNVD